MLTNSRTVPEICYVIDTTLTDLVNLRKQVNSNNEALNYCLIDSVGTFEILKSLKEVGDLLGDPTLENKYSYFLKRAEERINSFNDSTSEYAQLLAQTEDLTKLIEELNQDMGLQKSMQTPVSALVDKICSFIELFYCYWTDDLFKHFQQFESFFCNMSLHKSVNCYGNYTYTDPTVQIAYLSFIHARLNIQESYLSGFMARPYLSTFPYNMPVPWDQRLYDIYGIIKPSWCI